MAQIKVLPGHPALPVWSGLTSMVRMCIRRARATRSGRLSFSSFQSKPFQDIRDCEAISAQEAAAFTAHQAEEAHKGWCERRTYTSICNMNDAQPSDSRSGMDLNFCLSHNRCMQRVQQSEVSLGWCTHVNGAICNICVSVSKQLPCPFSSLFGGKARAGLFPSFAMPPLLLLLLLNRRFRWLWLWLLSCCWLELQLLICWIYIKRWYKKKYAFQFLNLCSAPDLSVKPRSVSCCLISKGYIFSESPE